MTTMDQYSSAYWEILKRDFIFAHEQFVHAQARYQIALGHTESRAFTAHSNAVTDVVDAMNTIQSLISGAALSTYCNQLYHLPLASLNIDADVWQGDVTFFGIKHIYKDRYARVCLTLTDVLAFVQEDQVPEVSLNGGPQITTLQIFPSDEWQVSKQLTSKRTEMALGWCINAMGTALSLLEVTPHIVNQVSLARDWHQKLVSCFNDMTIGPSPLRMNDEGNESWSGITQKVLDELSEKIEESMPSFKSLVDTLEGEGTAQQKQDAFLLKASARRLHGFWVERFRRRIKAAGGTLTYEYLNEPSAGGLGL